jgi:hypothetical protein
MLLISHFDIPKMISMRARIREFELTHSGEVVRARLSDLNIKSSMLDQFEHCGHVDKRLQRFSGSLRLSFPFHERAILQLYP